MADTRTVEGKFIHFLAGEHIANSVDRLVAAAREYGSASGFFNDIELKATATTTPEEVVSFYNSEIDRRVAAFINSPEGKEAERKREADRSSAQQLHDALMAKLPSLDMSNDVAVLDWLCQMQGPSDHIGVIVRRQTIVQTFEKYGFRAGENCGADYRPGDRKNMHRYLVGQALDGLKEGPAIHSILHKFADEWRAQFGVGASS
jgi:heme-degrading monooxygenase HmoA